MANSESNPTDLGPDRTKNHFSSFNASNLIGCFAAIGALVLAAFIAFQKSTTARVPQNLLLAMVSAV
jgi:hypothetical protein